MKILHLRQAHKLPFESKPSMEYVFAVIQSQFKIAEIILEHPGAPILVEGFTEDRKPWPKEEVVQIIKATFPNGFPKERSQLTAAQSNMLYQQGAAFILAHLGLCAVHPTLSPIIADRVMKKLAESEAAALFTNTEVEAMNFARAFFENHVPENPETQILLVFGAHHDFSSLCLREGFELSTLNTTSVPNSSPEAIASLKTWLAILTPQLKEHPNDAETQSAFKTILKRIKTLSSGSSVSITEKASSMYSNVSNLLNTTEKPKPKEYLEAELEVWQERNFKIGTVITAVKTADYALALRRIAALGRYDLLKLICKYDQELFIDYHAKSSNGYGPLEWVRSAGIDEGLRSKIETILMEKMNPKSTMSCEITASTPDLTSITGSMHLMFQRENAVTASAVIDEPNNSLNSVANP